MPLAERFRRRSLAPLAHRARLDERPASRRHGSWILRAGEAYSVVVGHELPLTQAGKLRLPHARRFVTLCFDHAAAAAVARPLQPIVLTKAEGLERVAPGGAAQPRGHALIARAD
jgi:hypothetical protein